jgi:hypothetical protein
MNAKHVVKTFFESDFYKDTSILEKTLHEDFELYWNSSSGYFKLNKETFTQMLLEMSKSFEFLRCDITHLLEEDGTVTLRHSFHVKTIENPDDITPLAHFISIAVEEPDEIYLIGMDLYSNYNDRYNNLYKGTEGYMGEGGNAIPPDNWIAQHGMVMEQFPNVQHYKVNKLSLGSDVINQEIEEWKVLQNLEYLTYAEMIGRLTNR